MSPKSPSSRAAPEGPIPLRSRSELPVAELLVGLLELRVDSGQVFDELGGQLVAGAGDGVDRRWHGPEQVGRLAPGEELLRAARDQVEQQPVQAPDDLGAGLAGVRRGGRPAARPSRRRL